MLPHRKYGNKPTVVDGLSFQSKVEANRYGELLILQKAGFVAGLKVQPRFPLIINGVTICTYVADFSYEENNHLVVEDVKSPATKTPVYKLKKTLMKAIHGIDVVEVMRRAKR